jgi:hypothetical protein
MAVQPTQSVRFAGDLQQLRERLQISATQQAAWATYQRSVEAYSEQFFAETPLSSYAAQTAPKQISLLADTWQSRVDTLRTIERNVQALYALLDARQKQTADQHLLASIPVFGNPPLGQ